MLTRIANKCTQVLLNNSIIIKDKEDIFIYGFELFFSTLFAILGIILTSIICLRPDIGFVFLLFFIPIRLFAGGFHASTYGRCFVCTNAVFIVVLLLSVFTLNKVGFLISGILFLCSLIYIWKNAPIEHKDAPLSQSKRDYNEKMAKKILGIEVLCITIVYILKGNQIAYTAVLTTVVVAFMMIITKDRR